jgi:hypothetical protein
MKVSADGAGVASHAGCELLRELAAATGLVGAWDKALIGTLISNGGPSVVDPRAVRANALVGVSIQTRAGFMAVRQLGAASTACP